MRIIQSMDSVSRSWTATMGRWIVIGLMGAGVTRGGVRSAIRLICHGISGVMAKATKAWQPV